MSGGRRRKGARNFVPQKRSKLLSVILKGSKLKKCTHIDVILTRSGSLDTGNDDLDDATSGEGR